ncbi:hypothetical protein EXN66_Car013669 [Channa argus]|uniref:Reverse transcriptase domain-containing protein n=1 Tax=Channa argus TaxID=215402 RepID=A0A6G1Q6U8_CHAAH|nr:hypothetical protein EXN66_Car013669 [Channa argus]
MLYTLFNYDCVASHKDNIIVKFADDTAVTGRIAGGDEAAYRREVASLVSWCGDNNLTLNMDKTKEMIVDMRKDRRTHQPPRKRLQRVVKTAQKITWTPLPSLQSIYHCRVHRRAASILKDPSLPQHGLFTLLPSGRR